jgi:uncharacterized membrane protein YtjA (UPF0391 family)
MALGLHRFLTTLGMVAFAVMFSGRPVALGRVFVVFRCLAMSVPGHVSFPWFELQRPLNASPACIVPDVAQLAFGKRRCPAAIGRPPIGTRQTPWSLPATATSAGSEDIMLGWAIAFLVIALIAAALGLGVVAGTALAGAKIIFVAALFAFLVSAILGLSRRGVP